MTAETSHSRSFQVGDWQVDPALDTISRDGTSTKLVPKTMQVLTYLAQRAGEVATQEEIEKCVWPNVIVTPSSVYQAIADLRRALGDNRREPTYISTVPRKGYRLIATVTWSHPAAPTSQRPALDAPTAVVIEATATPAPPADPVEVPQRAVTETAENGTSSAPFSSSASTPSAPPLTWTKRTSALRIGATVGGIALAALVVAFGWLRLLGGGEVSPMAASAPALSIAVLPVTDFSEHGSEAHFADGLTEELLNTLAQIPDLKVTARTSAFAAKERNEDVRDIGKALGARYVLESSVRRDRSLVRVTAQLIDSLDGYHLWSKTFDRPAGDVLRVQEEIAHAVASSLQITLTRESAASFAARQPKTVDALELYLLGRHYQVQRTPDSIAKAIDYQRRAIAADPGFALAYAGLADAYNMSYYYSDRELAETVALVEPLIEEGLRLNPNLPELYAARATIRNESLQLALARQDLEKVIALNPNYAEAYVRLGIAHDYDGRPRDALRAFAKAAELDPLNSVVHGRRCLALQNLGRYREARAACDRATELAPDLPNGYVTTGLIALSSGQLELAIDGYRQALQRAPHRIDLLVGLGWLYLDVGRPLDAKATMDAALAAQGGSAAGSVYLERARWLLTEGSSGAPQRLREYLDASALAESSDPDTLIDFALLCLVAGQPERANIAAQRAVHATDFSLARLRDVWHARWGRSHLLTLALTARAAGDTAAEQRYIQTLAEFLDHLERNGHVLHGLHYLRANVLALQGRSEAAIRELQKAEELGWRRAWWARHDPALASLRRDPRFEEWLKSLQARSKSTSSV